MRIDRAPDDRLQRMMDDPETYLAEARQRARALVERDLQWALRRRRQQRRARLARWFGLRGWKS